ncbi:MAG TPA: hypothetical protein VMN39_00075 [Longimicrobiaceae bacterium]|nr:hypothetical protein [Longimicrobiaceae bacterium]
MCGRTAALTFIISLAFAACTNPVAYSAAGANRENAKRIELDMQRSEVLDIMGDFWHRTAEKTADGGYREELSWLTVYAQHIYVVVTFENDRVVEITEEVGPNPARGRP